MNLKEVVWLVNFHAPALMIEVAEVGGRKCRWVGQIGHQHAHLAGAGNMANESHRLGRCGALVVGVIAPAGRRQRDGLVVRIRARKVATDRGQIPSWVADQLTARPGDWSARKQRGTLLGWRVRTSDCVAGNWPDAAGRQWLCLGGRCVERSARASCGTAACFGGAMDAGFDWLCGLICREAERREERAPAARGAAAARQQMGDSPASCRPPQRQ